MNQCRGDPEEIFTRGRIVKARGGFLPIDALSSLNSPDSRQAVADFSTNAPTRRTNVIRRLLLSGGLVLAVACGEDAVAPSGLEGTYQLVEENGQPLPSDPSAPFGCCLTLSGELILTSSRYELRTSHRNKINGIMFENWEEGTYTRQGSALTFVATDFEMPYLLAPGVVLADGPTVILRYGDEGPGSDQIEGRFARQQ